MNFTVDKRVFEAMPSACFGVVIAKGIDNKGSYPRIQELLHQGVQAAEERFLDKKVKEDGAILPYREAFQTLGINPNKFMISIEALVTRISKGKGMPEINPIVDIGNAMSLKYVLPMGAHDIDLLTGDMEIRFSREGDTFLPFGEEAEETMPADELVYISGSHVRTRRWIWRQSEIGKITEDTKNIFFPIDGFTGVNDHAILSAREELARHCAEIFGCKDVRVAMVNKDNPSVEL